MARPGFGTRFDNDGGGNHIQRIKDRQTKKFTGGVFYKDSTKRFCPMCKLKKPRAGSSGVGDRFKCAECTRAMMKLKMNHE